MSHHPFRFGVDYYPEQWPEDRWSIDARMMRAAGFNTVRLAEFAWSRLEPEEGTFDFSWLDRAIALLAAEGMQIVLGTPTASPPIWVMKKYPDAYRVLEDGRRLTFGHRRHYCPNHPGFQDLSRVIVTAMARHYAENPHVIGWQTDNEFGDRCYCANCADAFARWLARRHGDTAGMNANWGTVFWSQDYADFTDVVLPSRIARAPNPGLQLDYFRFSSDSYVAYQDIHIDILRRECPGHLITHNLMGFKFDQINYFDLAAPLDFVSWDNYPRLAWTMVESVDVPGVALAHDTMRGLKGRGFWVMEAQSGSGGWEDVSVMPRPGEIRLWAWQAIAHGADGVIFFRWRTARFGAEQYWHGVLDHHGDVGRRYHEVAAMGAEIDRLGTSLLQTAPVPKVAMILSYDSRFAFQAQGNNPGFSYPAHLHSLYTAFHRRGIEVAIIPPEGDLSSYRIVLAPALHVLPETVADSLRSYVEAGGVLLGTARSGVKDIHNAVCEDHLPGLLRGVFGLSVEDYDSPAIGVSVPLAAAAGYGGPGHNEGESAAATGWADILALEGAEPIKIYAGEYYAGRVAVARHRLGRGQAIYAGTFGNAALHEALALLLLAESGLGAEAVALPAGVELCRRASATGGPPLLFLLNHTASPASLTLEGQYEDLLTGSLLGPDVSIPPRDLRLLRPTA